MTQESLKNLRVGLSWLLAIGGVVVLFIMYKEEPTKQIVSSPKGK